MAESDNTTSAPRLRLGEIGHVGLTVLGGNILEECRHELRWPHSVRTFKQMSNDAVIASGLKLFEKMMCKPEWTVKVPEKASDATKRRAELVEQMMHDMEHSWRTFVQEAVSFYTYGFSVHEKVYRKRLTSAGSKYNDGFIGIRKLPIRAQNSIYKWDWDGRDLKGLWQYPMPSDRKGLLHYSFNPERPDLTRAKFLLFRTNVQKSNPEGQSPLVNCWREWKIREAIEENEAIGISRDMRGTPILYIPSIYMSEEATEKQRFIYDYYKRAINNLHQNESSGMILPNDTFEDGKTRQFEFSLLGVGGSKTYDTNSIIKRYDNKIMMAMFSDVLRMGQDQVGSYSLADSKTSLTAMAIENELDNFRDELNFDLMKQIYQLNRWDMTEMCYFDYEGFKDTDLNILSQAIQRMVSVGGIEVDRPVLNITRQAIGAEPLPEDVEPRKEFITDTSRAGDGMRAGGINGTSRTVSRDNSASNKENS